MAACRYFMKTRKAADWMHTENEDYMLQSRFNFMNDTSVDLLVVSDGMGGLENGKAASGICAKTFAASFYIHLLDMYQPEQKNFTMMHYCDNLKTAISQAFVQANEAVVSLMEDGCETGCTLSVAVVLGDYMICANVGDSPVYYYEDQTGKMKVISTLQTLAEEEAAKGMYAYFSPEYYANDHILVHYMGEFKDLPESVIRYYTCEKVSSGDMLLLGSDGAFGRMQPEEILTVLKEENEHQALMKLFETAALDKDDDQTAILIKF